MAVTDFDVAAIGITILVVYLMLSRTIPIWLTRGKEEAEDYSGFAGTGYNQGVSVYSYGWMASVILVIFFMLPFYPRSGAFTMPRFLAKRHDSHSRLAFSAFNVFTDAAAGPTSHRRSTAEGLGHRVPPARWRSPKRRRRRPEAVRRPVDRWVA